ncbi:MAG: class I SAM-dependent methyltransferase [Candidatus Brocadiae bacterium]|nr:class I SAM-dependent methyltransferase [Candidatus Brocadiia bacterium]
MDASIPVSRINDFDAIADVYDELVEWAPYEVWVAELEERLRRWGLKSGGWILDAACGTGLSMLPWLQRGYRVVGADVSEPMLERCGGRLRQAGYNVELLRQDLLHLEPGRAFDAAICMHSGLDYILDEGDLEAAFRSLRGCLERGGLLAFDKCLDEPAFYRDDYSDSRRLSCGSARFEYRWDRSRRLLEQRCTVLRTRGSGPARTEVVYHLKAIRPDELIAMVLRAGFVVVEAPKQFTIPDPGMGIFRAI